MRVWNYMLAMRHDVKRRTFLLDQVREKYLKDVMTVKSALAHAAKNVRLLSYSGSARMRSTVPITVLIHCAHPRRVCSQLIMICARFKRSS